MSNVSFERSGEEKQPSWTQPSRLRSGRVLCLQLPDNGVGHSPAEPSVLKPSHHARTPFLQGQAAPSQPLLGCLSKEMIHGSFWEPMWGLVFVTTVVLEHAPRRLVHFGLWHPFLAKCLIGKKINMRYLMNDRNISMKVSTKLMSTGIRVLTATQHRYT